MGELGRLLTQARLARGLTLEAAERETRIARRYLEALEREDFSALPAPVFARGFLRSYSQYLGLDPAQVLPLMPRDSPDPRISPLPEVGREAPPAFNASWLIAVALLVLLGLTGFVAYRAASSASGGRSNTAVVTPSAGGPGALTNRPAVQGTLPDLRGVPVETAIIRLHELGVPYVVIEHVQQGTPPGQVYEQTPKAGAKLGERSAVTLWVARQP